MALLDDEFETALGKDSTKKRHKSAVKSKVKDEIDPRAETVSTVERDELGARTFTEWLDYHGNVLEPGQRVLAEVMFDGRDPIDLVGDDAKRAIAMFGCETVPLDARRLGIRLAVCGGRGGKSLLAAWRLVHLAATVPLQLSPGEQAYAIIVAPDQRLSEQVLRYCTGIAREWFPQKGRVIEESSLGFTLVRATTCVEGDRIEDERVRFVVLPATQGGRSLRGHAWVGAVLDEAAFFRGEDAAINDRDVIDAVLPRVMMGGELIITTTPYARAGEVFSLFDRNYGHPVDAVVAHAPTWVLRSDERILAQVERERARDPWNFSREFGAQFIERTEGMFFEPDNLRACVATAGVR